MTERRLALTKKVSLAELSEGWEDCYAVVRSATYQDYSDFVAHDIEKMSPVEQIKLEMDFVKEHFISGQIRIFGNDPTAPTALVDMQPDDIEASTPLANLLFFEILGVKPDPKALSTTTATS